MLEHHMWSRRAMYAQAKELLAARAPELSVLEVSGRAFQKLLPWRRYRNVYKYDVCGQSLDELNERFDLVVYDNVLQHLPDPEAALVNAFCATSPTGGVFVAVPTIARVTPAPDDFWRWTAAGLMTDLRAAGYRSVNVDSWGNLLCLGDIVADETTDASLQDMVNDPSWPVMAWGAGWK